MNDILGYLRGGYNGIDIRTTAAESPELLARCIAYLSNQKYHRQNTVKAVLALINDADPAYRGSGWKLIQELPLSHLLEIHEVMDNSDNTNRVRHAIATKIARSEPDEVLRAFFIAPSAYRDMFGKLYIPRDTIHDKPITNASYKAAYRLSQMSVHEALETTGLSKTDLLKRLHLPFHMVMEFVESPEEAIQLSESCGSKTFFDHIRWFRTIMGDEAYERVALDKMRSLKNPMDFLSKKKHLEDTGAFTERITEYMEDRAREVMAELMAKFDLESVALIVDVSGSMNVAVEITKKLYEALAKIGSTKVTDVIAFNNVAYDISPEELPKLQVGGMTSIGASIVLLAQKLRDRNGRNVPQAIIMVTDLEENTPPDFNTSLRLLDEFDNPPLVVLLVGRRYIPVDYPNGTIKVSDFHEGLLMDIMEEVARITSKVAVKEREITNVIRERKPIEEEIGAIPLPRRDPESLQPGFLERMLVENIHSVDSVVGRLTN